jgi:hypothetical protein
MASTLVMTSNLDLNVGEECWKTDLKVVGTRSMHLVVAIIQLEAVVGT